MAVEQNAVFGTGGEERRLVLLGAWTLMTDIIIVLYILDFDILNLP